MTLAVKYNNEMIQIFGWEEKKCPICEQSNEIFLKRISDNKIFCVECYKAYKIGQKDMIKEVLKWLQEAMLESETLDEIKSPIKIIAKINRWNDEYQRKSESGADKTG